jgi:hypothetical protein
MLNQEIMEERSIAEIECRKDTLEIVESTLTTPVNNYLQEIVSSVETEEEDEQREFDGNITILFDQQQHILYSTFKSVVIKHNDNDTMITTIPFRVSVTGDLAFYAMFLGKDGMSTKECWCWLCKQSYQQWQNLNVDPSQHWTLKSIKDTASTLNNGATELGIKKPPLLTSIRVRMYIIPMLHVLIGIVNRLLKHCLDFVNDTLEDIPESVRLLKSRYYDLLLQLDARKERESDWNRQNMTELTHLRLRRAELKKIEKNLHVVKQTVRR